MSLYLVGENIDKTRSHSMAGTGKLIQLMRGIYADAADNIDALVLAHAVRIAKYLYPKAYLSAASAALLGPTRDGRLFLSARRKQRTRIRTLEIIQNDAPKHPSVSSAVVVDDMGEIHIDVSSIHQRFLEAFRVRSEHAASIDDAMKATMASRLVEQHETSKAAADAVWSLARENEWYKEGEAAERYLEHRLAIEPVKNQTTLDLLVAWHGTPIGRLTHDGLEWRWEAMDHNIPPLVRQTVPGKLPPFIVSLLPEGWLERVLKEKDERAILRTGKRYMSNIAIVEHQSQLSTLPRDILLIGLKNYTEAGRFTGRYAGPGRGDIEESFERNLAKIYSSAETPRLSGVQIKAPMCLEPDGKLSPSTDKPFTHILKPAGTSGFEALPVIEWAAMELGRAAGFEAPATALATMPDDMPAALIVERFDIRRGPDDERMLALEDFCSVLDLPPTAKYDGTMERIARAIRPLSTAPDEDVMTIFKRALFAWLIADGDMHLKNMALLKVAYPGEGRFRSVRIAPLYDAVTTRVFPRLGADRMALKLNGKDDQLRRNDFMRFAATAGLKSSDAELAIENILKWLMESIDQLTLPKALQCGPEEEKAFRTMLNIVHDRLVRFQ